MGSTAPCVYARRLDPSGFGFGTLLPFAFMIDFQRRGLTKRCAKTSCILHRAPAVPPMRNLPRTSTLGQLALLRPFPSALAFLFLLETQRKEKASAFGPLFLTITPGLPFPKFVSSVTLRFLSTIFPFQRRSDFPRDTSMSNKRFLFPNRNPFLKPLKSKK